MRLDYFLPSPQYRDVLTIHAAVEHGEASRVERLPAMLPNLYVRLAGQSCFMFADGRRVDAPPVALLGPTGSSHCIELGQGCRLVVVGLLPAGWLTLFGVAGIECADQVIDGAVIWGAPAAAELVERLQAGTLDGGHTHLIEAFLSRRRARASARSLQQIAVIDHWLEHSGGSGLDVLCGRLDLGARQLRRVTLDCYGLSPKTLAMKYRVLRQAALMSQSGKIEMAAALEDYADQSHLIRDFGRFVGWTPAAFVRDHQNIAAATLSGRRKAGAVRPLALWS